MEGKDKQGKKAELLNPLNIMGGLMVTVCTLDISMRFENSHNEIFNRRLLSPKLWGSTEAGRTVSAGCLMEGRRNRTSY